MLSGRAYHLRSVAGEVTQIMTPSLTLEQKVAQGNFILYLLTRSLLFSLFVCCSGESSSSNFSKYACAVAAVVCFFLLLGSGGGESENDMLRSGQAKRPTTLQTGGVTVDTTTASDYSEPPEDQGGATYAGADIDANGEVASTEDALESAQQQAIVANQELLTRSVEKVLRSIRTEFTELLQDSDDFDEDEITTLINRIDVKLNDKVNEEMKLRSDELRESKKAQMETMVDVDTEGADGQPFDLDEQKQKLAISLRDDIGETAVTLKGEIKDFAIEIKKYTFEAFLKEKFGKTYVVKLEDDLVVSYKKKSSSSSTHSSSGSTSKHKSSSSSSGHKSSSSTHKSSSSHHSSSSGTKKTSSHHSNGSHHSSSTHKKVAPEPEESGSSEEDNGW